LSEKVACESEAGLTAAQKLSGVLEAVGGMASIVPPRSRVLIKPNFVGPFEKAVTSFELLEAIVEEVRAAGGTPFIADSSGFEFNTEATFRAIGAYKFAERIGVELLNLDHQPFRQVPVGRGRVPQFLVSAPVLEADRIINVPRLKGHSITRFTFGLKNMLGCVARATRRSIHVMGLSRGIVELNRLIHSDLCIVDGLSYLGRAVFDAEQPLGLVAAGRSVVATDIACCRILKIDYRRVKHIRLAARELEEAGTGPGGAEPEIVGDIPPSVPASLRSGVLPSLHCAGMWGLYAVDWVYCTLFGGTVIPKFHYYVALRPRIDYRRCDLCGECARACPASAIDMQTCTIDPGRCMYLRCLRCVEACPNNAVSVTGLRKPSTARGRKNPAPAGAGGEHSNRADKGEALSGANAPAGRKSQ